MKYFIGFILLATVAMYSCKDEKAATKEMPKEITTTDYKSVEKTVEKKVKEVKEEAVSKSKPVIDNSKKQAERISEKIEVVESKKVEEVKKDVAQVKKDVTQVKKSDIKARRSTDSGTASTIGSGDNEVKKGTHGILKRTTVDMSKYRHSPDLKVTVPETNNSVNDKKKSIPKPENKIKEEVEEVGVPSKSQVPNKPGPMNIDHAVFHKLLSSNVSNNGAVNYKSIKGSPALDSYLKMLEATDVSKLSQSQQLAFWINAYNAFTIKKVVSNYPLISITDLDGGKPWDKKWINLNGKTLSLNDIENVIIRPQFKEPRIHFAVNCAAKSCPPLLNQAYSAGNLNTHMENLAKQFINNPKYNKIANDKVVISKIFEWYKEDFGNIISYLNKYSDTKISDNATVEYMDYDWSLNDK